MKPYYNDDAKYHSDLLHHIYQGDESELRGRMFDLPRSAVREPRALFQHQVEAVEAALSANGGASGIIHLPTGAGKTVVALELMKELLRRDARTVFIWATYGKTVLRQGFGRLAEEASYFPVPLTATWLGGAPEDLTDLFDQSNVVFVTRHTLTTWLDDEGDGRRRPGPLRTALTSTGALGRPVVLIYDECHELGAEKLQNAWRKFAGAVLRGDSRARRRFRVYGLSATPLPSGEPTRDLLREEIFPIQRDTVSARPEWQLLVHKSERMSKLIERRILCPINEFMQKRGGFDIPEKLIRHIGKEKIPRLSRQGSRRKQANEFAMRFNREVMSDGRVLEHLADRLGANLERLGKTVVYTASIGAANKLVALLKRDPRVGSGRVTLVHSRMEDDELVDQDIDDQAAEQAYQNAAAQIAKFRSMGSAPCIMVNVGMLTTGFDDPKIRTIVLARLTFSTNLFWQMIGRGLRGTEVGGTSDCYVIDPVRLTDRFEVFAGYKPDLSRGGLSDDTARELRGRLDPEELAPSVVDDLPAAGAEADLRHLRTEVAEALRDFLRAETPVTAEATAALVAKVTVTATPDGQLQFNERKVTDTNESSEQTALSIIKARLNARGQKLGVDFDWVFSVLPPYLSQSALNFAYKVVERIEELDIRDRDAWMQYQASRI